MKIAFSSLVPPIVSKCNVGLYNADKCKISGFKVFCLFDFKLQPFCSIQGTFQIEFPLQSDLHVRGVEQLNINANQIPGKYTGMIFLINEIWSHTRPSQEAVWAIHVSPSSPLPSVQWSLSGLRVSSVWNTCSVSGFSAMKKKKKKKEKKERWCHWSGILC